jgi:hypothetical protein
MESGVSETDARVVYLFRDRSVQLVVNARHREARLDALRRGLPETVDGLAAPPDELAARRARSESPTMP